MFDRSPPLFCPFPVQTDLESRNSSARSRSSRPWALAAPAATPEARPGARSARRSRRTARGRSAPPASACSASGSEDSVDRAMNAVTSLISRPRMVRTLSANGRYAPAAVVPAVEGERRLAVGPDRAGAASASPPTAARPRGRPPAPRCRDASSGPAASRSRRPRSASRPPPRCRRGPTRRHSSCTTSRMPSSPSERRVACWLCSGSRSSVALRARCRALFTEAVVVSRISPTSRAEKPSTSRRISTARWLAGRCWSAAMNASSTLSRCS